VPVPANVIKHNRFLLLLRSHCTHSRPQPKATNMDAALGVPAILPDTLEAETASTSLQKSHPGLYAQIDVAAIEIKPELMGK